GRSRWGVSGGGISLKLPIRRGQMPGPPRRGIDALVGPATPQFAYQLRARVEELVKDLPEGDPVRGYGEEKMELLDRLGHASSKAETGGRLRRRGAGWGGMPRAAPGAPPLPRRPRTGRPFGPAPGPAPRPCRRGRAGPPRR